MIITNRSVSINESDYWGRGTITKIRTCEVLSAQEAMTDSLARPADFARHMSRHSGSSWWNFNRSGKDILEMLMNGDPAFYEQVKTKMSELNVTLSKPDNSNYKHKVRRRKRVKGDFGNEVDIHAVRQGRIDRAWTNTKHELRDSQDTRLVYLVLNTVLPGGQEADGVNWRTALMMLVHDDLVRLGKSVAVSLAWKTNATFIHDNNSTANVMYVPIKTSNQRLSPEHFATYGSAAYARLIMMYRMHAMCEWQVTGSYGHCLNSFEVLPKPLADAQKNGAHIIQVGRCFGKVDALRMYSEIMEQVRNRNAKATDIKQTTARSGYGAGNY